MPPQAIVLPFKAWRPDDRALDNGALRRAWGAIPFYKNYLVSPGVNFLLAGLSKPFGFHLHQNLNSGTLAHQAFAYYGAETDLYEILLSGVLVENPVGSGAYSFGAFSKFWDFTSFGNNVVATNFNNPVQYQAQPGISTFADLITSTFKPQARFAFSIRQNLFLANLNVLAPGYGALATGKHPWGVCWSQDGNLRAFGGKDVDPQLTGAGYNNLGNDFGPITGGVGGDFGILFHRSGITRIDGPPYEFRDIVSSQGCVQPDSIVRIDDDIYFWGTRGPSVLRGGEPPVEVLTEGSLTRTLLDDQTGFSEIAASLDFSGFIHKRIHVAVDPVNGIIRWSYQPFGDTDFSDLDGSGNPTGAFLDYNYLERRFGATNLRALDNDTRYRIWGLGSIGPGESDRWAPLAGCYGLLATTAEPANQWSLVSFGLTTDPKADVVFQTALGRLAPGRTTRIQKVRPLYAKKPGSAAVTTSVTITSTNDPKEDEATFGPYTTMNEGRIATPTTQEKHFHSVQLTIDPDATGDGENIFEIEGVEVEFVPGGEYGS